MKTSLSIPLLCLLLHSFFSFSLAEEAQPEKVHPLMGKWEVQTINEWGEKEKPPFAIMLSFKQEGKLSMSFAEEQSQGSYQLDDTQEPKWLDFSLLDEDGEVVTSVLALYRVEGDVLIICNDSMNEDTKRPESMKPSEDTVVVTLNRVKDEAEAKPAPEPQLEEAAAGQDGKSN